MVIGVMPDRFAWQVPDMWVPYQLRRGVIRPEGQEPAEAASRSTAPRRWSEPSRPGTPAACSPTSGQWPAPRRAPGADDFDAGYSSVKFTVTVITDADSGETPAPILPTASIA
jgi:hypothetical protein